MMLHKLVNLGTVFSKASDFIKLFNTYNAGSTTIRIIKDRRMVEWKKSCV